MPIRTQNIDQKKGGRGNRNPKKEVFKYMVYPEIPYSISDLYVSTITGDRLDLLAHQFLGDVDHWWIISIANPDIIRRDSYILEEGLEVRIPSNLSQILEDFKELNK